MTISELAKRLEISPHTLRYYEKVGLIRNVERVNGRRFYVGSDQTWLEFILRLKNAGMPLAQIQRYSELRYEGDSTISERKAMLHSYRQELEDNIKKLQSYLVILDQKIETYDTMEKEYESLRKRPGKTQ